jgi:hypothetical protein
MMDLLMHINALRLADLQREAARERLTRLAVAPRPRWPDRLGRAVAALARDRRGVMGDTDRALCCPSGCCTQGA